MNVGLGLALRNKLSSRTMVTGPWVSIPDPTVVELMAALGSDFLLMDGEHSAMQAKDLKAVLPCAENQQAPVIYRIPSPSSVELKFALDAGACGVMVPMIETPEQAASAVTGCRYAPLGNRGIGPWRASDYYKNLSSYLSIANDAITLILQVETKLGLENVEAIAAIEGFDVLYVGPADLANSLGLPIGEFGQELCAALAHICNAGLGQGKVMGIDAPSLSSIPELMEMGFSFFTIGSEMEFISCAGGELALNLAQLNGGVHEN